MQLEVRTKRNRDLEMTAGPFMHLRPRRAIGEVMFGDFAFKVQLDTYPTMVPVISMSRYVADSAARIE